MRTLYITEEQERSLKNRVILAESDDRIKKVNKIIDTEFSNLLNLNEPVSGPEYYVNNNPETTWRAYLLFSLRHTFGLMTNADMKYLPVVAKLAYSDEVGFDKRNDNGNKIGILLKIVGLFKKDDAGNKMYIGLLNSFNEETIVIDNIEILRKDISQIKTVYDW